MSNITTFQAVRTILSTNTTLSKYIRAVTEGVKDDIPTNLFPCIILEIAKTKEDPLSMPRRREFEFDIVISALDLYRNDNAIIGTPNIIGILQMELDIKRCLSANPTLNGTCLRSDFDESRYFVDTQTYRGVEIDFKIYYRQDTTNRT